MTRSVARAHFGSAPAMFHFDISLAATRPPLDYFETPRTWPCGARQDEVSTVTSRDGAHTWPLALTHQRTGAARVGKCARDLREAMLPSTPIRRKRSSPARGRDRGARMKQVRS